METDMLAPPDAAAYAIDESLAEPAAVLETLIATQPAATLALVRSLLRGAPEALTRAVARLTEAEEADRGVDGDVDILASNAVHAQHVFEKWSGDRVDRLLADLAGTFADAAENLAAATVRETGLGNVADKTLKNRFASAGIYASLAGKVAHGALSADPARRVTQLASPVGVVFAVAPVTNPVATAMFKTLIALKAQNALILSFHRDAFGTGQLAAAIIRDVLEAHGAPAHLVQVLRQRGDRRVTGKLMRHPRISLILATGSAGLVKAAYSSGTPAIGVGPGNAPAWICADADLDRAASAIVTSKTFDNGLICGAEHNLVVDDRVVDRFAQALERHGAAILSADEAHWFACAAFGGPLGSLRREFVGRSAAAIADAVGIHRAMPPRLLIIRATADNIALYGREKLAPFLSLFSVNGEDEGLRLSHDLLIGAGTGHTASIHTTNAARVERFARAMPAARILVNSPAAQGCCGMTTGLEPSLTLGCGTFGGNATTDNVTYRHLLNIKRVAHGLQQTARLRGSSNEDVCE
jgi:acetaldehyde dehydrogenase/alcohol dehydrogenase